MKTLFNQIILNTLLQFIKENNLSYFEQHLSFSNSQKQYIFGHSKHVKKLNNFVIEKILQFNIFTPISQFIYPHQNYLIKFDSSYNLIIFSTLLQQFLNTEYEHLFFSSISKIIPIDFCVENQSWEIVKKILTIKPLKSNGLPEVPHSRRFFELLLQYTSESDFQTSFFTFCENNKTLLKRTENQEYLKIFLHKSHNFETFKQFVVDTDQPLTQMKQEYFSFYINKKVLFSRFSTIVDNKREPVFKLIDIFSELKKCHIKQSFILSSFIEQTDTKFSELLIFVSFSDKLTYSFEDYYLYLLDYFLRNDIPIHENIKKVSDYYFLQLNLPAKSNKKEKITKL